MNTSRRSSIGALALAAAVLATTSLVCTQAAADARKPNVIIVFVDDLGWTDLGCYGSKFYETPHIAGWAKLGALFPRAYSSCNVCSPSGPRPSPRATAVVRRP
jgi:arylsulfatase A